MSYFDKRLSLILQLGFNESALAKLKAYIESLWAANEELNLISRKMSFEDLIDNHLLDCLLPLNRFPLGLKKVADFGSGGGLPGIVYALQFPLTLFQLFEKSPKKRAFLESCKKTLKLNIEIQSEVSKELKGIDLVTSRAFKSIETTLELSRDYYRGGGKYFLLKARREKIEEESLEALKKFKDLNINIEALKSPVLEVERHLVLISRASLSPN